MPAPSVITLTTDFGLSDTYVGVMKGVILGINPDARLVDLTHDIRPQDLMEASVRLQGAVPYFPPGTIHLVVVDPGVGTSRGMVIVRTAASTFVAPDNGVLTLPLRSQPPIDAILLTEAAHSFFLKPVSTTFHGRDIFAPIAAHLSAGLPPVRFGLPYAPADLVALPILAIEYREIPGGTEIRAPVLYVDHFGNLITALHHEDLEDFVESGESGALLDEDVEITMGAKRWTGISTTFASVPVGAPLAYWGSAGRLEVAVRYGSAAELMGAAVGDKISLRW